jgi:hypothetical protein
MMHREVDPTSSSKCSGMSIADSDTYKKSFPLRLKQTIMSVSHFKWVSFARLKKLFFLLRNCSAFALLLDIFCGLCGNVVNWW